MREYATVKITKNSDRKFLWLAFFIDIKDNFPHWLNKPNGLMIQLEKSYWINWELRCWLHIRNETEIDAFSSEISIDTAHYLRYK